MLAKMWEAAVFYQQRAKDAHGAGNPILAQACTNAGKLC